MGQLLDIVTPLHQSTQRDYLARMVDNKVEAMLVAKKYEEDYWDGDRRYGYGGYRYIAGRWKSVAEALISRYQLTNSTFRVIITLYLPYFNIFRLITIIKSCF